jgi:hypothetical protein
MENRDPQTATWEKTLKALENSFHEAKIASNKVMVMRDWTQVHTCMHIMTEAEDLIWRSNHAHQWIYDPGLLAQRFQEELKLLKEHWAVTLAIQAHHWLRIFPDP